ncbi:HlyD family efflux transporter periplasmic adaptor subunit, partial [Alicyclobacillaceae bacterium I2511]
MSVNVAVAKGRLLGRTLKRKRWIYGGIATLVVLGTAGYFFQRNLTAGAAAPEPLYTVGYGSVTQTASTSGTLQTVTTVNLSFANASTGLLKTLNVQPGDHVKAGQVLATLDSTNQQTQVASAQVQVKQAAGNVATAEANLAKAEEGPTAATIAAAQANVAHAQAALQGSQLQYQAAVAAYNDRTTQEQAVVSAQNAVSQAKVALQSAQTSVSSGAATNQQQLTTAQQNLTRDEATLTTDQQQYGNVTAAQVQQDYQSYQSALSEYQSWSQQAYVGSNPYTTELSTTQQIYQEANTAYQALQTAQQVVQQDQAAVAQAQVALSSGQSSTQSSVSQAQEAYNAAVKNLQQAQAVYNDQTSAQEAVTQAKNTVTQNQTSVQQAQAALQEAEQPPDAASIQAAQASVQVAQAALQGAQVTLNTDETALQQTVLTAPIDGVLLQVNGAAGEAVSGSQPLFVIQPGNASQLELNLSVSETSIGSVNVGDPVAFTVTALPNQTFNGKITEIQPQPVTSNNVTQYTVLANIANSSPKLLNGMSVNATIQTNTVTHVLTVPATSLVTLGNLEGVYVEGTRPAGESFFGGGAGSGAGNKSATAGGTGAAHANGGSRKAAASTSSGSASGSIGGSAGGNATAKTGKAKTSGNFGNAPAGTYFQPVQIGLFGTNDVQVTGGLQAGESILLVPPGSTAAASATTGGA